MPLTVLDTDPDPTASIAVVDADGNATTPDDVPQWASSDTSVANVTASADGLSATIAKTGKTGATSISVTSTRSSDGAVLTGSDTLTVNPSEETAISLTLAAGAAAPAAVDAGGAASAAATDAAAPADPNAPAEPAPGTQTVAGQ